MLIGENSVGVKQHQGHQNILNKTKYMYYLDEEFELLPNVYEPCDDTFLLMEAALEVVRPTDSVLEIGTGCGLIAKTVAQLAQRVIATDINPHAVANAALNGVDVMQGDLFANLNRRFDLIVFNPPYLPSEPTLSSDSLNSAWDGGRSGRDVLLRFLSQVNKHLTSNGQVLIVISSITGYKEVHERMREHFPVVIKLAERKFSFETLYVILGRKGKSAV